MTETSSNNQPLSLALERPAIVNFAAVLLFINAVLILFWWILFPSDIASNGAQVFFIILWTSIAIAIYRGISWVRYATVILLLTFVGEVLNAKMPYELIANMNLAEQATKILSVIAIILVFVPQSHRWFREMRKLELQERSE